ncbi:TIGR01212 family radical SAM protein [Desulfosediminicola ganghwensis]|uniref:TIGR01212 family radical SAM protein n=1 Tax=Desulfosediminicola ganghwensis TaxID=2569540 RepID=UPI0010ACDE6E|nr:TIGR01212 family radical SAM protein [Desulfosediminicola ganghwensis]
MNQPIIRTFSHHYRQKYGVPVGKIPIDTGMICPNREKGGCIFCRPASFTPGYLDGTDDYLTQIERGKNTILKGRFSKYFAYFQQETCTAVPVDSFLPALSVILEDPDCIGLILSTRPDYVNDDLLEPLASLIFEKKKECLFELGLQTVHDKSLQLLNRNHSYHDFTNCVHRIKGYGKFEIGVHLIFGIPKENEEEMLVSVDKVCKLGINALKLHHLQVIRGTELEKMYQHNQFSPFTLDGYLEFLQKALVRIPSDITIHRLWATSHPELLVAPRWDILATHLSQKLQKKLQHNGLFQGSANLR